MGLLPATVLSTLLWAASSPATLADAIKDYDQFDDAVATDAFQDLLAHNPPGEVAAIAHLYLGLLAFNGFHPDLARAEFKQAIQANPAIEPPPGISPKAKLAFGAVREDMARAMSSSDGLQFSSPSAQAATARHLPRLRRTRTFFR